MIEVRNIDKFFDKRQVLFDVSLELEEGKKNLIIGRSGMGKTVLMKTILGLFRPDGGAVLFDGRAFDHNNKDVVYSIRKDIGMVFQGGALFDSINVLSNVMFTLDMFTNMSKKDKILRAEECLERVGLKGIGELFPSELSGGMKKRVAIARAIASNPKYLFCDEPNSGLDPQTSAKIDQLIADITKEYKTTTVINTHDMNSVLLYGDNIHFIHEGKKWWSGSKDDILLSKDEELLNFMKSSELTKRLLKQ